MNDADTLDDRETAIAGCRQESADAASGERTALRGARSLAAILLLVAGAPMAACSSTPPEQRAYDIADRRAVRLDKLAADRRACARRGGVIVQERHRPRSIRLGGSEPEAGGRYYCLY